MKLKAVLSVLAIVVLIVGAMAYRATSENNTGKKILYYSCPMHPSVKSDKAGSCSICGMALEPVYASDDATNQSSSATNNAASDSKPIPYPLDTCAYDGMKLGSMGDPYVFVYQGQEIKLCCAGCKSQFLADPDTYMKKIKDAEATQKK